MSHDRHFIASCSLDNIVKVLDVSHLEDRIKGKYDSTADEPAREMRMERHNKKK